MSQAFREEYYQDLRRRDSPVLQAFSGSLTPFWGISCCSSMLAFLPNSLLGNASSNSLPIPLDILGL